MSLPTVVDLGSYALRAGPANADEPPPVVTPAFARGGGGGGDGGARRALGRGGALAAAAGGDADALEAVLEYALYDQLGWEYGEEGNVLLSEPVFTSKVQREELTQLMFETFSVRGLFIAPQPVLALYAANRTTGVAVDCGHGSCTVTPVIDGVAQTAAARELRVGGEDVTRRLGRDVLAGAGGGASRLGEPGDFDADTYARGVDALSPAMGGAGELKEVCARVAPSRSAFAAGGGDAGAQGNGAPSGADAGAETFTLPDGRTFSVGESVRLTAGECLFDPALVGQGDESPLHNLVYQAVLACPADSRKALWETIVPCGGAACVEGFSERLQAGCAELAPPSTKAGVVRPPEYMPAGAVRHASWLGGAILAKIVFTQNQHMSHYDYDEEGPTAVHRKL